MTTRSIVRSRARATRASASVTPPGIASQRAMRPMPGLPGAATIASTSGSAASERTRACSRAPEPTTSTFTQTSVGAGGRGRSRRRGDSESGRRGGSDLLSLVVFRTRTHRVSYPLCSGSGRHRGGQHMRVRVRAERDGPGEQGGRAPGPPRSSAHSTARGCRSRAGHRLKSTRRTLTCGPNPRKVQPCRIAVNGGDPMRFAERESVPCPSRSTRSAVAP